MFTSVVRSSLWSLSGDCIKVFLTLCAESDPEGYVSASADGIRRLADLSLEDTRAHLARLEAPDPESKDRTRDATVDGKRIERVPNGWRIINLQWYRALARKEAELAKKRKWWNEKGSPAAKRELSNDNGLTEPTRPGTRPTYTETETKDLDTDVELERSPPAAKAARVSALDVARVWDHYRGALNKHRSKLDPKRERLIRTALKSYTVEELYEAINGCAKSDFHMGRLPGKPSKFAGIDLILRDGAHIDQFREFAAMPAGASQDNWWARAQ